MIGGLVVGTVLALVAVAFVVQPLLSSSSRPMKRLPLSPEPQPNTPGEEATPEAPTVSDEEVEAAVEAYRRTRSACPDCGVRSESNAAYCSNCGRHLRDRCAKCGAPVSAADARFCINCGSPLTT
jgi:hypothetical protein